MRSSIKDVATPFEPFTGKEDPFDCTTDGPDGFDDLTLKFGTVDLRSELGLDVLPVDEVVVLGVKGELFDGTPFVGEDVIQIVP